MTMPSALPETATMHITVALPEGSASPEIAITIEAMVSPASVAPVKLRRASGGGSGFSDTEVAPPARASIFVPMRFHRRGGRRVIIMPGHAPGPNTVDVKTLSPAVLALAHAHRWRKRIEAGEFASYEDLARSLGLIRSCVSRVPRLTLLAPDMIEDILDGRELSGFSLDAVYRANLPMEWPAQRRMFAFTAVK